MNDASTLERILGEDTRREFMKKGAVATTVAGVGATGTASAQDDGGILDEGWKGLSGSKTPTRTPGSRSFRAS